jgi:hypothetical protein
MVKGIINQKKLLNHAKLEHICCILLIVFIVPTTLLLSNLILTDHPIYRSKR